MTQKITPKVGCLSCFGTGYVSDFHPYGSTVAQEKSFCTCVIEQANDIENDEIEIVIDPVLAEQMVQEERAFEEMLAVDNIRNKTFMCTVCHVVEVFPALVGFCHA